MAHTFLSLLGFHARKRNPDIDWVQLAGYGLLAYGAYSYFLAPGASNPTYSGDATSDPNVSAFLATIRQAESGSVNGYNVYYGGSTFSNMSDHPVNNGEK